MINGDTWIKIDFLQLNRDLNKFDNPLTIVGLEIDVNDRYGSIILDNSNVIGFSHQQIREIKLMEGFI